MDAHFLRCGTQPPCRSRSHQISVSKRHKEQRQSVHGWCLGPSPTSQLPRLHDLEDSICDGGRWLGVWIVGVGYVRIYFLWHVCARPRGLHESIVWEGVEEGDGEGEVEDGSWGLVRFLSRPLHLLRNIIESKDSIRTSQPAYCTYSFGATEIVVNDRWEAIDLDLLEVRSRGLMLGLAAASRDGVTERSLKLHDLYLLSPSSSFTTTGYYLSYLSPFLTLLLSPSLPTSAMIRTLIPKGASRSAIRSSSCSSAIQPAGFCLYTSKNRGYATEASENYRKLVSGAC